MTKRDKIVEYLLNHGQKEVQTGSKVSKRFGLDKYRVFKDVHFTFVGERGQVLVGHSKNPAAACNFTKAYHRMIGV